jgi:hypothetical protein
MFNKFSFSENRAVNEIMWKNMEGPDRPQMTIWRMRIAFCIPKVTKSHSEHVIFITFHYTNVCTNAPQWYVLFTLSGFEFSVSSGARLERKNVICTIFTVF